MTEGLSKGNLPRLKDPLTRRDLVVGIGATLISFLTMIFAPMLGIIASVLTPLPTVLVYYRRGEPVGYWVPGGSAVIGGIVVLALGVGQSLVYLLELLLLGLLLGRGMRRGWSVGWIIGYTSLIVFGVGSLVFWFSHGGNPTDVFASIENEVREAIKMLVAQYGNSNTQDAFMRDALEKMIPIAVRLLPGLSMASIVLIAWLNLLITRYFCRLHQVPLPDWPPWSHWKSPDTLVWVVIAAGFMVLMPMGSIKFVGLNILIAIGVVYLLHGLAIVAFYFERWKLPGLVRGLGYGLIFIQQIVSLMVMLLGLFDIWLDFRKLSRRAADA